MCPHPAFICRVCPESRLPPTCWPSAFRGPARQAIRAYAASDLRLPPRVQSLGDQRLLTLMETTPVVPTPPDAPGS